LNSELGTADDGISDGDFAPNNEAAMTPDLGDQAGLPHCRAWNADQVGARLGCSARHVYRMADAGLMPWGFKFGSLRRWDAEGIDEWIVAGGKPVRQKTGRK